MLCYPQVNKKIEQLLPIASSLKMYVIYSKTRIAQICLFFKERNPDPSFGIRLMDTPVHCLSAIGCLILITLLLNGYAMR
jgi:hypothetical protein